MVQFCQLIFCTIYKYILNNFGKTPRILFIVLKIIVYKTMLLVQLYPTIVLPCVITLW